MDNGSTAACPEGDTAAAEQVYKDTLPYFNTVSASSPIFLVPGNHEQQEAWHWDTRRGRACRSWARTPRRSSS